ncbi:MAG TPA: preprotein translocase subunit SecG [Terriglobia bacterium]|nr:preprotein translocase subunit SecG [Terriglobia bacterium]
MHALVVSLYILVSLLILLVVLIQGGENVDITAAFGGVSQAAFGPRGTVSTLEKMTWVLGGMFLVLAITLTVWSSKPQVNSVLQHAPRPVPTAPAKAPAKKSPTPTPPNSNPFKP